SRLWLTRALPSPMPPAEPALRELVLVPDLAGEADLLGHPLRLARDLRRRQVAGRRVHQVTRPPDRLRDDRARPGGGFRRLRVPSRGDEHRALPQDRLVRGGLVAVEAVAPEIDGLDGSLHGAGGLE